MRLASPPALAAAAVAVAAAVAADPAPAAADALRALHLEGWYGKLGLETGVVFARERESAPLIGAAATFVHINRDLEWVGLQADLLADGNGGEDAGARWSVGPELGVAFFGVDVGYFGERVAGQTRHGGQVRAKLTAGLVAVYLRGTYTWTGAEATSVDAGLQLKLPVFTKRDRRSLREAARATGLAARPARPAAAAR